VRIKTPCEDEIDGVALAHLEVGLVYHVSASLGSYLVSTGCAEAMLEDELNRGEEQEFRVNVQKWRQVAADGVRRPRTPRSSL
jgi:hypothetical protein